MEPLVDFFFIVRIWVRQRALAGGVPIGLQLFEVEYVAIDVSDDD
jgi:hypothetical protein